MKFKFLNVSNTLQTLYRVLRNVLDIVYKVSLYCLRRSFSSQGTVLLQSSSYESLDVNSIRPPITSISASKIQMVNVECG